MRVPRTATRMAVHTVFDPRDPEGNATAEWFSGKKAGRRAAWFVLTQGEHEHVTQFTGRNLRNARPAWRRSPPTLAEQVHRWSA